MRERVFLIKVEYSFLSGCSYFVQFNDDYEVEVETPRPMSA